MTARELKTRRLRVAAIGMGIVLCLTAAGCKGHDNAGQSPAPKPTTPSPSATSATPAPSPKSKPAAYDPLSGGKKVDGPVIGVKIDNVQAARPQSGLYQADMVVAERVEGNLTRLLAIYHTQWPKRVGPVRSARNTDVDLLPMFSKHPGLVYSGANRKVQKQLQNSPIRTLERSDRDYSRPAPHNVFVDLDQIRKQSGIGTEQSIGFAFGKSSQWNSAAGAPSVKIPIGVDTFGFSYAGNHYRGTWNGQAQTDQNGTPVTIDNIVDLKVNYYKDTKTTSHLSYVADTVGKGTVVVYSHGRKITGTWQRSSTTGPMTLKTSSGKSIVLAPGHTWLMLQG
ncbi:hypothetical protein GCM10011575_26440 [Microlunatus endophyticus]|uniref:DUF3048 domain-containing protein n=1 Tax=Microlunatus endophyticus TaxID=1716077 RepID=A0A917W5T0_9ACTN|nr:DUF3048 domain-containing protein [Microlunatus endophyticus]GGL66645.1 hypothetical protein GCM10011575_26440 [Microlunatus endophyticus]